VSRDKTLSRGWRVARGFSQGGSAAPVGGQLAMTRRDLL
jgi:hypothetical protein